MIEYVEDRPGHDFRYSMSSNKISKEYGWKPKIGFEEGLFSHPGRTGMTKGLRPAHENPNENLTHPGETCQESHPDMSHKEWESTQTNEDNINFSKDEMAKLHDTGEIEKDGHTIKYKVKEDLKKAAQYYKDPNISEDVKAKLAEYIKQNYKKMGEGTCGYTHNAKTGRKNSIPGGKKGIEEDKPEGELGHRTDEIGYLIQQANKLNLINPDTIEVIKSWKAHGKEERIIDFLDNLIQGK